MALASSLPPSVMAALAKLGYICGEVLDGLTGLAPSARSRLLSVVERDDGLQPRGLVTPTTAMRSNKGASAPRSCLISNSRLVTRYSSYTAELWCACAVTEPPLPLTFTITTSLHRARLLLFHNVKLPHTCLPACSNLTELFSHTLLSLFISVPSPLPCH